jgi:hypothetical protein
MRIRRIIGLAAATAVGITICAAPQALAYDRETFEYAAGHMIDVSDIPASLGTFDARLNFNAGPGYSVYLCYVPSESPDDDGQQITAGKPTYTFGGTYSSKKGTGPTVQVDVLQFKSASAAIKAFSDVKSKAKGCSGRGSTSWTDEDGTVSTSSWSVSTSKVPGVAVAGVSSIGITQDNLSTSSDSTTKYIDDNYAVFSLVDDAIIATTYYTNGSTNPTKAQRKAVNQVAFNAISEWLD